MLRTLVLCPVALGLLAGVAGAQAGTAGQTDSVVVAGVQRAWRMYVPTSYQPGMPTPLVIDLHGSGSAPEAEAGLSQFEALAEQEGFLVATPAGMFRRSDNNSVSWNVDLDKDGVDDVAFIRAMIRRLSERYTIDAQRVYAAGMSGGARMSSRLGCDVSDLIAAIGPVAGIQYPANCGAGRPVPVLTFHGRMDPVNHYEHQANSPPYWDRGVEVAVSDWARHNGCSEHPVEHRVTAEVVRLSYAECNNGADVILYRSDDAGHTWPGSPAANILRALGLGETDPDVPATRLIWEFFKAHPLRLTAR